MDQTLIRSRAEIGRTKKELRVIDNFRDHRIRMRNQTRRPTPTAVRYGQYEMRKKRHI